MTDPNLPSSKIHVAVLIIAPLAIGAVTSGDEITAPILNSLPAPLIQDGVMADCVFYDGKQGHPRIIFNA